MCKYCSRLKELRLSDLNYFKRCIQRWKDRNLEAERLLTVIAIMLDTPNKTSLHSAAIEAVKKFVTKPYIGGRNG